MTKPLDKMRIALDVIEDILDLLNNSIKEVLFEFAGVETIASESDTYIVAIKVVDHRSVENR